MALAIVAAIKRRLRDRCSVLFARRRALHRPEVVSNAERPAIREEFVHACETISIAATFSGAAFSQVNKAARSFGDRPR